MHIPWSNLMSFKKKVLAVAISTAWFAFSEAAFAAAGYNATELGPNASAEGTGAVAIGSSAMAPGRWSTALGRDSHAEGDTSLAIAPESYAVGDRSIATGYQSRATASDSIALGSSSTASREAGTYGTATGAASFATLSTTDKNSSTWKSTSGVISIGANVGDIGSDGQQVTTAVTRQLTGLAAGSQDNDAVNVAQLKNLKSYSDATYATKSSLSGYLTTSSATSTYLSKSDAAATYATSESLNNYATTASLGDYLQTASFESTLNPYLEPMTSDIDELKTAMGSLKDLTPETISALKNLTENGVFTVTTDNEANTVTVRVMSTEESDLGSGEVGGETGGDIGATEPGEQPSGSSETIGLGSKLNFAGDSNVLTSLSKDEEGNVTVRMSMAEDVNVNSLTATNVSTENLTVNQQLKAGSIEATDISTVNLTAQNVQAADIVATNSLQAPSITFANGPTLSYNQEAGRLQYVSNTVAADEGEGAVTQSIATTKDGITFGANEGSSLVNLDNQTLDIKGADEFITTSISSNSNGATLEIKMTDEFRMALGNGNLENGITIGAKDGYQEIRIKQGDVSMGGNRIQNVGAPIAATDAANKQYVDSTANSLRSKIHDVDRDLRAGVAMAMAVGNLPQAYMPGKSILAMSAGTYHGQGGFALGLSHATNDRNWVFKGAASVDTRGNFGGTLSAGYQF